MKTTIILKEFSDLSSGTAKASEGSVLANPSPPKPVKPERKDSRPLLSSQGSDEQVTGSRSTLLSIKRIVIAVLGGTVLAFGIVLVVLPGPAFLVIPAGLAILAIEFAWAKRWLRSVRALLPRRPKDDSVTKKKLTMKSFLRSGGFLLRQVRRTLFLKNRNK